MTAAAGERRASKRAEDQAVRVHDLDAKACAKLRAKLPELLVPILRAVEMARDTAMEPIGALGHLATARAAISAVLDPALERAAAAKRRRAS